MNVSRLKNRPGNSSATMLLLAMLVMFALPAQAHKINMFAFVEGNEIFVEGYFGDGKKPKDSPVLVYNNEGEQLLEGRTDDEGTFTFTVPGSTPLRITLNAGQGHMAEYELNADELGSESDTQDVALSGAQPDSTPAEKTIAAIGLQADELQAIVRTTVGQSLRPVMRSLSELQERRTFSDIIGGIGIIMGIGGIFLYVKARKMTEQNGKS